MALITRHDSIRTHICERLNRQRRIETGTHRRERRATYYEQIGHVPALSISKVSGVDRQPLTLITVLGTMCQDVRRATYLTVTVTS
jgi:hypothetical protein